MFNIVRYHPSHFEDVLSVFRANTPAFFHENEENDLIHYLRYELEHYFVILDGQKVIGSGGINCLEDKHEIRISWDFILPEYHGKGAGTALLKHRLAFIQSHFGSEEIYVRTSQFAYPFYEKNGFQLTHTYPNFWAEGFDMYLMKFNA